MIAQNEINGRSPVNKQIKLIIAQSHISMVQGGF